MRNLKKIFLPLVLLGGLALQGCDWSFGGGGDTISNDEAFSSANFSGTYSNTLGNTLIPCIEVFVLQVEHIRNQIIIRTDRGDRLTGSIGPIGGSDGDFDGTSGDAIASFSVSGNIGRLDVTLSGSMQGTVAGQTLANRQISGTAVRSDGVSCAFAGAVFVAGQQ